MRKSLRIRLFDEDLLLFERSAFDVITISEMSGNSDIEQIQIAVQIIADSLKYNLDNIKFWQILRQIKYRKILKVKYIVKNLTIKQIEVLCNQITELEIGKKKDNLAENQLDAELQKA